MDVTIEDHWLAVVRPHTPQDLYDLMRNSHPFWSKQRYIFRGHSDAQWDLIPSAWRPENAALIHAGRPVVYDLLSMRPEMSGCADLYLDYQDGDVLAAGRQLASEFGVINSFYEAADAVGLGVPETKIQVHREQLDPDPWIVAANWFSDIKLKSWMPTPLFGLAQHHGIPTRLLDFSTSPKKALMFAASPIASGSMKPNEFAIWAVSDFYMANLAMGFYRPFAFDSVQIEIVRFPRSENSFLRHQDGVFLFFQGADHWRMVNGRYPSLNDMIASLFELPRTRGKSSTDIFSVPRTSFKFSVGHNGVSEFPTDGARVYCPFAYKVVAPASFAEEIYKYLYQDELTEAHLMPTYDNVARLVRAKNYAASLVR